MSSDRVHDLLLLLSMSGVAVGCSKGVTSSGMAPFGPGPGSSPDSSDDETSDDDGNRDDSSSGGGSSGSASDPILTSGDPSTGNVSITTDPLPETTTGMPETTSGPISTSGPESSSGPAESTSGPPPSGDACADYAVWAEDCYGYTDGQEWCEYQMYLGGIYYGPGCSSALEELFACLATQACGAVGCNTEQTNVNNACS